MKRSTSWIAVLPSLVIPVCIGMTLYLGLLAMIDHQVITDETVLRYLTGHPVSKISVAMFLVGMASLMQIGVNVFGQFRSESLIRLDEEKVGRICNSSIEFEPDEIDTAELEASSDSRQNENPSHTEANIESGQIANSSIGVVERAVACCKVMLELPHRTHDHYLWQRIVNTLHSVYRTGTAAHVEDELKHLAELDLDRQQQRYSLIQILIWATPMLGFLGTVLGISQALGGINVGPDNDFQQMMNGLRGSLYVAFDTTALALTLSMFLMFGQFLIDRFESQLLQRVDQRAHGEIAGQFNFTEVANEPAAYARENELLIAVKEAAETQTKIWRTSIEAAENAWLSSLTEVGDEVHSRFAEALDDSVSRLAHYLGETIEKGDLAMTHRWEQWQVLLSDNARLMATHQSQLTEQTELVQKLLKETRETELFESAISQNRDAIEQTSRLREILTELCEAVHELKSAEFQSKADPADPSLSVNVSPQPATSQIPAAGEQDEIADVQPWPASVTTPAEMVKQPAKSSSIPEIVLPDPENRFSQIIEVDLKTLESDSSTLAEVVLPHLKKAA